MQLSARLALVAVVFFAPACGGPQKPAVFASAVKPDAGLDIVGRTLVAEGRGTPTIDRQTSVVFGEWQNTAYNYGQVQGLPAVVVRRFTVVLAPAGEGSNVTVRIDAKQCAQGHFKAEGTELHGKCEEMPYIPEDFQKDIDALGAKIQSALTTAK